MDDGGSVAELLLPDGVQREAAASESAEASQSMWMSGPGMIGQLTFSQ